MVSIVGRDGVGLADEDEAVVDVDVAFVVLGQPDVILDLLVRRDAADEEEVYQAVLEDARQRRARRRLGDAVEIDGNRHHAGRREAQRLELLTVVVGVAEREVDVADQRRQLRVGRSTPAGTGWRRRARRSAPA